MAFAAITDFEKFSCVEIVDAPMLSIFELCLVVLKEGSDKIDALNDAIDLGDINSLSTASSRVDFGLQFDCAFVFSRSGALCTNDPKK